MQNRTVRGLLAAVVLVPFAVAGAWQQEQPKPPAEKPPAEKQPSEKQPAGKPVEGQAGERPRRGPGERGPGGPGGPQGQAASVEWSMKGMNRSFRKLRGQIADASKKDENLQLINDLERGCVTAKGLPLPEDVLKRAKGDAEKGAWIAGYRKGLMDALRLMLDMEQAVADGKTEEASVKFKALAKLREDSHKQLQVEED